MKRLGFFLSIACALACGSVDEKQACGVSTDCPVGQYCARAEGEGRCWPDAVAPTVSGVTASCGATCLRDGVLHVEATVADDAEVLGASVSVDLDSARSFPMVKSGPAWVADVPLRALPFDAFSRDVVATVTGRDGARNASGAVPAAAANVTRLRWERAIDSGVVVSPTSPAMMSDGTVVVGGSNGKVYFVSASGTEAHPALTVGTAPITAVPAVGERAIWVASEDFSLYGVALDGSSALAGVGVNTLGTAKGSVAVLAGAAKEWGFAASGSGRVGAASSPTDAPKEALTAGGDAYTTGPIIGLDGRVYAATATATAVLKAFTFDGAFTPNWATNVGVNVSAPLAVDAAGNIWTGSQDAKLTKTVPGDASGTATPIATLPGSIVDSPVILSNGDVVVGDQSGVLHRYSSAGTQQWSPEPNLGAAVLAPLVLSGGDGVFLVPTKSGAIHALRGDGTQVWSSSLDATELRAGNIFTPAGQSGTILSTAYFSAANGQLYAVIVDGQLDASAPWPKAFHDPKNTNRAGPQP